MDKLYKNIDQIAKKDIFSAPIIFNLAKEDRQNQLADILDKGFINQVSDDYAEQLKELFAIKNPTLVYTPDFENKFKNYLKTVESKNPLFEQGRWVYFPWLSALVHILEEKDFQLVRTARNCYLISPKEQEIFYNSVIGIGGLSVGNSVALAIVLQGGARHIKLADFDNLALSNTNRIRAGIQNLGLPKVEMTARQIYEINPYAKVEIFSEGLNPENIEKFFEGLDIVIDELDNIAIKFLIREQAKKHRLAVVMAADNGDNAVVDIERYDIDPQPEFFHGRIGKVTYKQLKNLGKFEIGQTIV
ncbi:MAG: ThiF family adenylyltransferase, partial [Candidatus Staskawiczbacteria bacterium]|nr:ThiF family adenylyltransferase [Candidatus Staskawiczbacteria bacterium]